MNPLARLNAWWHRLVAKTPQTPAEPPKAPQMAISTYLMALAAGASNLQRPKMVVQPPVVMPGAAPRSHILAMDAALCNVYEYANAMANGTGFMGYSFLAQLAQIPEYRAMSCRPASEMTRKWIKLRSASSSDKTLRIKTIEAALRRMNVRDLFRQVAEYDGLFGRGQLYIDVGELEQDELRVPLFLSKHKIGLGQLRGFKLIDPSTTYPYTYNSINPLAKDYFKPSSWFVMAQQVHASRLLTFVSRPLPDILKPAYNFGGMPMSQLAMVYVDNWYQTRSSVNKIVQNFSITGLETNMGDALSGGKGAQMFARAELFVKQRDNQGLFLTDKEKEKLFQINTPLGSLDKLQAQAQEHMAAVSNIPLVVLTGITPSGLNASSEGEIAVFDDYIQDQQNNLFRNPLEHVIKLIQLSELGDIDDDIVFDFEPLRQMDDEARARIQKTRADADAEYVAMGAISPKEVRVALAQNADSGFDGLNAAAPVPPVDPNFEAKKAPLLSAVAGVQPTNPTTGPFGRPMKGTGKKPRGVGDPKRQAHPAGQTQVAPPEPLPVEHQDKPLGAAEDPTKGFRA